MPRPDANRIALRACRAILDAAHDFTVTLGGVPIGVRCTPQAGAAWPPSSEGLDQGVDGPWPTPVTLDASWEGGSSRLVVSCEVWSPNPAVRNAVSLSVTVAATRRQVQWTTVATGLLQADDHTSAPLLASITPGKRIDGEDAATTERLTASLRQLLADAGLPFRTLANAHLGDVVLPAGAITPDAGLVFERLAIVALAKHAWFERRDRKGFEGRPFVDVAALADAAPASPTPPDDPVAGDDRWAGIFGLPGGVRAYASTLRTLLADIEDRKPLSVAGLEALFGERYQATGKAALDAYRFVLRATGFVTDAGGEVTLTPAGLAWLASPDPRALFEVLHARFEGMIPPLVLAEVAPALPRAQVHDLLRTVLGKTWKTGNQADFRRNWLLSLGLTERTSTGDAITDAGRAVLAAHADEAEEARDAIREVLSVEGPAAPLVPDPDDEPAAEAPADASPAVAPGWLSAQLDLSAATLRAHLGKLQLDDRVLEQLAAAVSSGKHVLFVGPPGTGKTELALALTRAAAAEGYCAGLFTATASADWTTFDTIGGYAMEKDQTLAFRPGAFLRALLDHKWLLVDELNRADVDRAFGELMTVLAGQGTDTPYELEGGRRVSIGAEEHRTFRVPPSFRVLATMNVWDKTSLFRLSYAVQRRFALITVGLPPAPVYEAILAAAATDGALLPPLAPAHLPTVTRLFSPAGLLAVREIGPAVALDVVRYLRRRGEAADGVAEAIEMFVLPQLQGLGERQAKVARERCEEALGAGASAAARASLRERFRELFPGLAPGDD